MTRQPSTPLADDDRGARAAFVRAPWAQAPAGPVPLLRLGPRLGPRFTAVCGAIGTRCRSVFMTRNYALFMGGSFVSALGSWFQSVAIGWLVLQLSNSAFVLGLSNFMQMAPVFFLGLAGGVLADRVDRRRLLLAGIGTSTTAVALLAFLTSIGWAGIPTILGLSLVLGLTNAIIWPTWQPFIKELVPEERLREAIAYNSARFNLSRVIGPALAGLLMARVGAPLCLAVAAAGGGGVLIATWLIRREPAHRRATNDPWTDALGQAFGYVRHDRFVLRLLLVSGVFGLLVMPYQAFLPAFARDVLQIGPGGLGTLLAAVGVGAMAGAVLSGTRLVAPRPGVAMAVAALIAGAGLAGFAVAPRGAGGQPWAAIFALALTGLGTVSYLTTGSSTLQLRVPEELAGRIMSLWVVLNAGTMPLGGLLLGGLSERFGLPAVLFWCGLTGLAIGALALATRAFAGSRESAPAEATAIVSSEPRPQPEANSQGNHEHEEAQRAAA